MEPMEAHEFADVIREAMEEQTFGPDGTTVIGEVTTTLKGHDYRLSDGTAFRVTVEKIRG